MLQPSKARRARPNMPRYGVTPDVVDGMLAWDWIDGQLDRARNYWVCSVCADGRPHSVPVWGVWVEGDLYFGGDRQSVKARNIARDNRVALHLDSGDETVIIEGRVEEAKVPADAAREDHRTLCGEVRSGSRIRGIRRFAAAPAVRESHGLARARLPRHSDLLAL